MYGPVSLLHVIGGKQICYTTELVKEIVLVTIHRRRANNGGFWKDGASFLLASALGDLSNDFHGRVEV